MIALLLSLALAQQAAQRPKTLEPPEPSEPAAEAQAADQATAVTAHLVLKVGQPIEAADALVAETTKLGGWFQARTQDHVELRVPVARFEQLIDAAEALGKVADRGAAREDLTRPLAEARQRLKSRQELLEKYYEVLKTADDKSIVRVETQVVQAIEVIEALQGQIRVLEDRADHARVSVSFTFRDRQAPRRDGSSSFAWLNTLNVVDVAYGMQQRTPAWKTKTVVSTPDGFSAWRKPSRYRAASPNGVLYRVRSEKHKPQADVDFWREAVRERMSAAGYKVVAETERPTGGRIELASPLGTEDWTYIVQFTVDGKKLHVAEAAGEVSRLDGHRSSLEKALDTL